MQLEGFFRNKKLFAIVIAALFVVVTSLIVLLSRLSGGDLDAGETNSQLSSIASLEVQEDESEEKYSSDEVSDDESGVIEEANEEEPNITITSSISDDGELRAVYITPGIDFSEDGSDLNQALAEAKNLTMNTVVVTPGKDRKEPDPQILKLVTESAHEQGMQVFSLFLASNGESNLNLDSVNSLPERIEQLLEASPDGLLIDSYYNASEDGAYADYIKSGSGVGYKEHLRSFPEALVRSVSDIARSSGLKVGLIADGVWENSENNPEGSNTKATFTALRDGNADTRSFVLNGMVDFLVMRPGGTMASTSEPFEAEAEWWSSVAEIGGLPFYTAHLSDKLGNGYGSPDELARQVTAAREYSNYGGSMFTSLTGLLTYPQSGANLLNNLYEGSWALVTQTVSASPGNNSTSSQTSSTSSSLKNPEEPENKPSESKPQTEAPPKQNSEPAKLKVSMPESTEYSTDSSSVTFRGTADPNLPLTVDGLEIEVSSNGSFTITKELDTGISTFVLQQGETKHTYRITRSAKILKSVLPSGEEDIGVGETLTVTAYAYPDADLSFKLDGETTEMKRKEDADENGYAKFTGSYTCSGSGDLGTITVTASWQGLTETLTGASVYARKREAAGDGDLIVVTSDSAKTFPGDVLNNVTNPDYFPLPRGTKDYTVGKELTFTNDSGTYKYYKLQSGLRVYSKDIQKTSGNLSTGNSIRSMNISKDRRYTYVSLDTAQPVPYKVQLNSGRISFSFQYTSSTPNSQSVSNSPIINSADWSGSTLTLSFTRSVAYTGYYAYYDGGTLVLRFNNPPTSMSDVRIAIDPGHGGGDKGADGYGSVKEAVVCSEIAKKTASALKSLGASVYLLDTSGGMSLDGRVAEARSFNANIFISIHCNSSEANPNGTGSEAYYFRNHSSSLAATASAKVSSALNIPNRGAKQGAYVVAADSSCTSILMETGFISSKYDYDKLTSSSYQNKVAEALANAVSSYINTVSAGVTGGGSAQVNDSDNQDDDSSDTTLKGIDVAEVQLELLVGDVERLSATLKPENADAEITWKSSDESVVTVNSRGKVTAVQQGTAIITATAGRFSASCEVDVYEG